MQMEGDKRQTAYDPTDPSQSRTTTPAAHIISPSLPPHCPPQGTTKIFNNYQYHHHADHAATTAAESPPPPPPLVVAGTPAAAAVIITPTTTTTLIPPTFAKGATLEADTPTTPTTRNTAAAADLAGGGQVDGDVVTVVGISPLATLASALDKIHRADSLSSIAEQSSSCHVVDPPPSPPRYLSGLHGPTDDSLPADPDGMAEFVYPNDTADWPDDNLGDPHPFHPPPPPLPQGEFFQCSSPIAPKRGSELVCVNTRCSCIPPCTDTTTAAHVGPAASLYRTPPPVVLCWAKSSPSMFDTPNSLETTLLHTTTPPTTTQCSGDLTAAAFPPQHTPLRQMSYPLTAYCLMDRACSSSNTHPHHNHHSNIRRYKCCTDARMSGCLQRRRYRGHQTARPFVPPICPHAAAVSGTPPSSSSLPLFRHSSDNLSSAAAAASVHPHYYSHHHNHLAAGHHRRDSPVNLHPLLPPEQHARGERCRSSYNHSSSSMLPSTENETYRLPNVFMYSPYDGLQGSHCASCRRCRCCSSSSPCCRTSSSLLQQQQQQINNSSAILAAAEAASPSTATEDYYIYYPPRKGTHNSSCFGYQTDLPPPTTTTTTSHFMESTTAGTAAASSSHHNNNPQQQPQPCLLRDSCNSSGCCACAAAPMRDHHPAIPPLDLPQPDGRNCYADNTANDAAAAYGYDTTTDRGTDDTQEFDDEELTVADYTRRSRHPDTQQQHQQRSGGRRNPWPARRTHVSDEWHDDDDGRRYSNAEVDNTTAADDHHHMRGRGSSSLYPSSTTTTTEGRCLLSVLSNSISSMGVWLSKLTTPEAPLSAWGRSFGTLQEGLLCDYDDDDVDCRGDDEPVLLTHRTLQQEAATAAAAVRPVLAASSSSAVQSSKLSFSSHSSFVRMAKYTNTSNGGIGNFKKGNSLATDQPVRHWTITTTATGGCSFDSPTPTRSSYEQLLDDRMQGGVVYNGGDEEEDDSHPAPFSMEQSCAPADSCSSEISNDHDDQLDVSTTMVQFNPIAMSSFAAISAQQSYRDLCTNVSSIGGGEDDDDDDNDVDVDEAVHTNDSLHLPPPKMTAPSRGCRSTGLTVHYNEQQLNASADYYTAPLSQRMTGADQRSPGFEANNNLLLESLPQYAWSQPPQPLPPQPLPPQPLPPQPLPPQALVSAPNEITDADGDATSTTRSSSKRTMTSGGEGSATELAPEYSKSSFMFSQQLAYVFSLLTDEQQVM